jgi:hypothetical protein
MSAQAIAQVASGLLHYHVYGMAIAIDRPVPRLQPTQPGDDDLPVRLTLGRVPQALENAEVGDEQFQANEREYLFRFQDRWAIHVRDGVKAIFEAAADVSEELFWYLAVTNAVAVAGYQRGMFPLHGSGVLFPQGVVAFAGHSGAGKTTAVAGLVQRGFGLMADDLCLIRPDGSGYRVGRGAPELRLIGDAADALGWHAEDAIGFQPVRNKFAFVEDCAALADAPLAAVVELGFADGPPRLERLTKAAPMLTMVAAIRLRMALHLFPAARRSNAFALVSGLARDLPVYRFTRPRDFDAFDAGMRVLIKRFGG